MKTEQQLSVDRPSNDGTRWWEAVDLVGRAWAAPFLEAVGLPDEVARCGDVVRGAVADAARRRGVRAGDALPGAVRDVARQVIDDLAAALGPGAAVAFDTWLQRVVLDEEAVRAFLSWRVLLRCAQGDGPARSRAIAPPASLRAALPRIADLLSRDRERALVAALRRAATPEPGESWDDVAVQVHLVHEITLCAWTGEAMDVIASRSTAGELRAVAHWAGRQAGALRVPPHVLGEARLPLEARLTA